MKPTSFGIFVLFSTADEAKKALDLFNSPEKGIAFSPSSVFVQGANTPFDDTPIPPVAPRALNVPPPPAPPSPAVNYYEAHGRVTPAGGEELDADGVPHDPTIHSSGKTKNADGRWTRGRKKSVAPTVPAPQTPLASTRTMIQTPTTIPAAPAPQAPPAFTPPVQHQPAPVQQPAPTQQPTAYPSDFSGVLSWLYSPSVQLSADAPPVTEALHQLGFTELAGLASRPDMISRFIDQVNANCQR